jgi:hypothetical protein
LKKTPDGNWKIFENIHKQTVFLCLKTLELNKNKEKMFPAFHYFRGKGKTFCILNCFFLDKINVLKKFFISNKLFYFCRNYSIN